MKQLSLPFSINSELLLDNFVGGKNAQIVDFIRQLFTQKSSAVVYIYGDKSSGKTRILQGAVFEAWKRKYEAVYIDFSQFVAAELPDDFSQIDWLCLDNIDSLNTLQQCYLFDLYNIIAELNLKLIISAKPHSSALNVFTDLKTRLGLGVSFQLQRLDDNSKKLVIEEQMKSRNLKIENKVYDYLFKYYSRDLNVLLAAIDDLDKASLQQKRNISIAFVKQQLVGLEY